MTTNRVQLLFQTAKQHLENKERSGRHMSMHSPGNITKRTAQIHHLNRWNISIFEKISMCKKDSKSFANLLCTTTLKIQQLKMPEIIWRTAEAPRCSHNTVVLLTCLFFHHWRDQAIRRTIHLSHPASSCQNQYLYTTVPFCSNRATAGNQRQKYFKFSFPSNCQY